MDETSTVTIYALEDPRTGQTRYVGQTRGTVVERLAGHLGTMGLRRSPKSAKSAWLRELAAQELLPTMRVLERVRREDADAAEYRWIAQLRQAGLPLVNSERAAPLGRVPDPTARPDGPATFTVGQAARHLGISPRRVRAMVHSGLLPAAHFGRDLAIPATAVVTLAATERKPGRPPKTKHKED